MEVPTDYCSKGLRIVYTCQRVTTFGRCRFNKQFSDQAFWVESCLNKEMALFLRREKGRVPNCLEKDRLFSLIIKFSRPN